MRILCSGASPGAGSYLFERFTRVCQRVQKKVLAGREHPLANQIARAKNFVTLLPSLKLGNQLKAIVLTRA
jgi:hypothetical protein